MKRVCLSVLSILVLVLTACAARPGAEDSQAAPRRQSNQISMEEIREVQAQNTYDVIRSLRPNWLQSRGPLSLNNPAAGQVVVYLDGARAGNVEILRQIPPTDVQRAQFLSATEATARFGTDHAGGVIIITTRRR